MQATKPRRDRSRLRSTPPSPETSDWVLIAAILAASPQAKTEPVNLMRILVVDDEKRFAAAVAQGLKAEGLAVDVAHDGLDGLAMASCGEYARSCWI